MLPNSQNVTVNTGHFVDFNLVNILAVEELLRDTRPEFFCEKLYKIRKCLDTQMIHRSSSLLSGMMELKCICRIKSF